MNTDELMSDPAQPFPSSSQEQSSQKASAELNSKKFREEYDIAKSRLADQKFDITKYADPLLPRGPSSTTTQKFTPEVERRLQELVADIKGSI
ncbi:hypothetical protein GE09DRAFT_1212951 [Coniochaeta sp. 2T2.1]|nr:hypothetical protein GE09DRAFT_1212951 [Coniochaeta sp. 2T2.1]